MPQLSDNARQEAYARESDAAWLTCITIEHADIEGTLRFVDDNQDLGRTVEGQAETFTAYPFAIDLPGDDPENPAKVSLTAWDGQNAIAHAVRGLRPVPQVTVEIVTSKDPDVVERGPYLLTLKNRDSVDGQTIGEFGFEDILDDAIAVHTTPKTNPGLFA